MKTYQVILLSLLMNVFMSNAQKLDVHESSKNKMALIFANNQLGNEERNKYQIIHMGFKDYQLLQNSLAQSKIVPRGDTIIPSPHREKTIYIYNNYILVDELIIYSRGKLINSNAGYFKNNLDFNNYKKKQIYSYSISLSPSNVAVNFISSLAGKSGVYFKDRSNLYYFSYPGSFTIEVNNSDTTTVKYETEKLLSQSQKKDIKVVKIGGGPGVSLFEIYCNKSYADAFSQYKVFGKWRASGELKLTFFVENKKSLEKLRKKHGL